MKKRYRITEHSPNQFVIEHTCDDIKWTYELNPWNGGLVVLDFFSEASAKKYVDGLIAKTLKQNLAQESLNKFRAENPPKEYP